MKRAELKTVIENIKTAVPVSIDIISKPSNMRKTNNPYYNDVKKHVTLSGMIGMSYGNAVNNQLGRENKELDFEPKNHKWITRYENNIAVNDNTGKEYLPVKVQSSSKPVYMVNGVDVTEQIKPFIRESSAPKTQEKLDKKIIWRTPCLDNIKTIRMSGATYTIK